MLKVIVQNVIYDTMIAVMSNDCCVPQGAKDFSKNVTTLPLPTKYKNIILDIFKQNHQQCKLVIRHKLEGWGWYISSHIYIPRHRVLDWNYVSETFLKSHLSCFYPSFEISNTNRNNIFSLSFRWSDWCFSKNRTLWLAIDVNYHKMIIMETLIVQLLSLSDF